MWARQLDNSWTIVEESSSGSVISSSYLNVTSSWLIEHACNDPQGSTEREEYIVKGAI